MVAALAIYVIDGFGPSLRMFLQLCAAFAVAFLLLYALAKLKGQDASWRWIVPTAVVGAGLGGLASAAVALGPQWTDFFANARLRYEWEIGAAFGAFFVGLSLVTSAVRQSEQAEFETRQRLLEARLKMLSARIEPHFLMNSLANLRYLIKSDPSTAYEMLDHLSGFL
ncbi:MAG: histidine kinase, partial [Gammaproteobacteria bacterium]